MKNTAFMILDKAYNNINIELLEHGYYFGDNTWLHYDLVSPFNRLYYVLGGEAYVICNHKKVLLTPGNLYLIPINSLTTYVCEADIEKLYLHIKVSAFYGRDLFEAASTCLQMPFNIDEINNIVSLLKENSLNGVLALKALIFKDIFKLLQTVEKAPNADYDTMYKYINLYKYIVNSLSAQLTQNEVCKYLEVAPTTFLKNYKKDTGHTLKYFMSEALAQKASEKLLLTNHSIKQIAFDLKFSDEFYFSRFFKKHTGLSPREYRSKNSLK